MRQPLILKDGTELKERLATGTPVILYFSTPQCSVCHAVLPQLMDLVEKDPIDVLKIDASELPEPAAQHLVFTAPTILVYAEGKEVLRESRFIDFGRIRRLLDLLLND